MIYLPAKELSSETLLLSTEAKEAVTADKVVYTIPPREGLRVEIQKELKELIKQEELVLDPSLIKYNNFEKIQNDLVLIRETGDKSGIEEFQPRDLEETCQVLMMVLQIMTVYHNQGVVLNGLAPGQLKRTLAGKVLLQDPPVINHISKSLNELYQSPMPPEIIQGKAWNQKTDIFAWGVLAYRLLAGVDPFASDNSSDRAAKIIRALVLPLRDYKPELSQEINDLIISCLQPLPNQRPDLSKLSERFSKIIANGNWQAPLAEAKDYATKAENNKVRYKIKEKIWLWFRKFGWVTVGLVAVSLLIVFLIFLSKPEGVLTSKTPPQQVIQYYFKAVDQVDVSLLDETVTNTKNSFDELLASVHVINASQQGMTNSKKGNIQIKVINLKVTPLAVATDRVSYRIAYTLKTVFPDMVQYIERVDRFDLTPVHKIWRITAIKILHEKNWEEKLNPTLKPAPSQK